MFPLARLVPSPFDASIVSANAARFRLGNHVQCVGTKKGQASRRHRSTFHGAFVPCDGMASMARVEASESTAQHEELGVVRASTRRNVASVPETSWRALEEARGSPIDPTVPARISTLRRRTWSHPSLSTWWMHRP